MLYCLDHLWLAYSMIYQCKIIISLHFMQDKIYCFYRSQDDHDLIHDLMAYLIFDDDHHS